MNNDMFAHRDEFVAQFAKVLKDEGWQADFKENEKYWSFLRSFSGFDVTFVFSGRDIQQLTRTPCVNFSAGLSKSDLSSIQQDIMPPVKGYDASPVIVASCPIEKEIPALQEDHEAFIRNLSGQVIQWAEVQDIDTCIGCFAKPWETEKQVTHLAALAYVGDFNTLMEYREMFKRGSRANFYPMIKPEMIDRAIDIALERA